MKNEFHENIIIRCSETISAVVNDINNYETEKHQKRLTEGLLKRNADRPKNSNYATWKKNVYYPNIW